MGCSGSRSAGTEDSPEFSVRGESGSTPAPAPAAQHNAEEGHQPQFVAARDPELQERSIPHMARSASTEKFLKQRATMSPNQPKSKFSVEEDNSRKTGVHLSNTAGGFDNPHSEDYSREAPVNERKTRMARTTRIRSDDDVALEPNVPIMSEASMRTKGRKIQFAGPHEEEPPAPLSELVSGFAQLSHRLSAAAEAVGEMVSGVLPAASLATLSENTTAEDAEVKDAKTTKGTSMDEARRKSLALASAIPGLLAAPKPSPPELPPPPAVDTASRKSVALASAIPGLLAAPNPPPPEPPLPAVDTASRKSVALASAIGFGLIAPPKQEHSGDISVLRQQVLLLHEQLQVWNAFARGSRAGAKRARPILSLSHSGDIESLRQQVRMLQELCAVWNVFATRQRTRAEVSA
jgi:hypothetical protein